MSRAIGIDVGTHTCRMAVVDRRLPRILPGPDGTMHTPMSVYFAENKLLVGSAAEEHAARAPAHTIRS